MKGPATQARETGLTEMMTPKSARKLSWWSRENLYRGRSYIWFPLTLAAAARTEVRVQVPAPWFLIELPVNAPGKAT